VSVGVTVSVQVSTISDALDRGHCTANSGCSFQGIRDRRASRNFLGICADRERDCVCRENDSGIKRSRRLSLKATVIGYSPFCRCNLLNGLALMRLVNVKTKRYLFEWHNTTRKETTTLIDTAAKGTLARGERWRELTGQAGSSLMHRVGIPYRFGFGGRSEGGGNSHNIRARLSLALQTRRRILQFW
jgi:hypothetical protein